ncbi:MAG: hypothetical protein HQ522_02100 [Bacteroidetes bacterium]|nr:hypothetical protein [Bacteroidota bacterium]
MKKYFVLLGLVFFVALAKAGPPPGENLSFDLKEVIIMVEQDAIVSDVTLCSKVWEVTHRPPYLLHATVNSSVTDNYSECTDFLFSVPKTTEVEFTLKHPPTLLTRGRKMKEYKTFEINMQNCNYGYPLSSERQIFFFIVIFS